MTSNLFDLGSVTDSALAASFRREGRPALHDAAGVSLVLHCLYRGRGAAARSLVDAGHRAGLHESAALGDAARIAGLLDAAPWSIDLLSPDGWTALHLAAFFGHADAARMLIERGADAMLWSRSFERNLPIHAAAAGRSRDLELLDSLIAATDDIDVVQAEGYSALLIAASNGKAEWVGALARAGADRTRRATDGRGLAELGPGR